MAETKFQDIAQSFTSGDSLNESTEKYVRENIKIHGKTVEEWWKHFYVQILPTFLTPEKAKELDAQIARLYQEASFFHSVSSMQLQIVERGSETTYRAAYAQLIEDWKNSHDGKLPSAATLDTLAKNQQDDIYSAIIQAKIAKDLWKDILNSLDTCRKLVDNATMNSHIEYKIATNTL